jgi:hypothetical protein
MFGMNHNIPKNRTRTFFAETENLLDMAICRSAGKSLCKNRAALQRLFAFRNPADLSKVQTASPTNLEHGRVSISAQFLALGRYS